MIDVPSRKETGLRRDYLSLLEVWAQPIGAMAPSSGMGILIPLVFASAGNGTWLLFFAMTAAYVLVAFNINQFASRIETPGALYSYVEVGLGSFWGAVSGWAMIVAYLFAVASVAGGMVNYLNYFLHFIFGNRFDLVASFFFFTIGIGLAWWIAYKDIRLSADLTLYVEVFSLIFIFVLIFAYFFKSGKWIDRPQWTFEGVTLGNMQLGLVLAFYGATGFESSTALGEESKRARRFVPESVLGSLIPVGVLYLIVSYTLINCFRGASVALDKSDAPFSALAQAAGMNFLGPIVAFGMVLSFFGCTLACLNAGARVIYAMAKRSLLNKKAGEIHPKNATPSVGTHLTSAIGMALAFFLLLIGCNATDIYNYLGQISSFGFLFSYLLVCAAAPFYLKSLGELKGHHILVAILAILALLIPIIGSLYPVPPPPQNYLIYIFLAIIVAGSGYSLWTKSRAIRS